MTDNMNWRYGDTSPIFMEVYGDTFIEIGDLLWKDKDHAKPAWDLPGTVENGLSRHFASRFLGVALQRSMPSDIGPIRVATTGVFEFACPSSTFELGYLISAFWTPGAKMLESQKVEGVSVPSVAIGRVAKQVSEPAGTVLVNIDSTIVAEKENHEQTSETTESRNT